MGHDGSPVVEDGVKFLVESMRDDGSWPIDTNLATWVTTLSIGALAEAGALAAQDTPSMREWLLGQQSTREHPFTHAAPGAWAWTPLSGGVPDADDTSGALLALRQLGDPDPRSVAAAAAGVRWLMGVQNRDGGMPTFCRGWGTLPFDRSTPEITAHALQAWSVWCPHFDPALQRELRGAAAKAREVRGIHPEAGRHVDSAVVRQRARARRGQRHLRDGSCPSRSPCQPESWTAPSAGLSPTRRPMAARGAERRRRLGRQPRRAFVR